MLPITQARGRLVCALAPRADFHTPPATGELISAPIPHTTWRVGQGRALDNPRRVELEPSPAVGGRAAPWPGYTRYRDVQGFSSKCPTGRIERRCHRRLPDGRGRRRRPEWSRTRHP